MSFLQSLTPQPPNLEEYSHQLTIDTEKIGGALPAILGKTVPHVVLASHANGRSQLFLVFADETHYEFHSHGYLSGARCVDRGGLEHVRRATREAKALTEVCSDGA